MKRYLEKYFIKRSFYKQNKFIKNAFNSVGGRNKSSHIFSEIVINIIL